MGILEINFQGREFYDENYKIALIALIKRDTSLLIKHRKQDLIAKYIIKSKIKKAWSNFQLKKSL